MKSSRESSRMPAPNEDDRKKPMDGAVASLSLTSGSCHRCFRCEKVVEVRYECRLCEEACCENVHIMSLMVSVIVSSVVRYGIIEESVFSTSAWPWVKPCRRHLSFNPHLRAVGNAIF